MKLETYLAKQERCDRVNELLRVIGSLGRRFFKHQNPEAPLNSYVWRFARMEVDQNTGFIYHHDAYTGRRIYTHYTGDWKGFTNGGTLHRLIELFRDFIQFGEPIKAQVFGPWPEWVCSGDLWGYGEDMRLVRESAIALGIYQAGGDR